MAPELTFAVIAAGALLFFLKCLQAFSRDIRPPRPRRQPGDLVSPEIYQEAKTRPAR